MAPAGGGGGGDAAWVRTYLEGDRYIDDSTAPWTEVVVEAGTTTELTRKKLRDISGNGVASIRTVIASEKDA